ncbi:hypothetical protein AcV5_008454 [Taiwanofungus camphoratus]|nr:hypothetical protein AcV5_008454 [Antrodia cinnamomea]
MFEAVLLACQIRKHSSDLGTTLSVRTALAPETTANGPNAVPSDADGGMMAFRKHHKPDCASRTSTTCRCTAPDELPLSHGVVSMEILVKHPGASFRSQMRWPDVLSEGSTTRSSPSAAYYACKGLHETIVSLSHRYRCLLRVLRASHGANASMHQSETAWCSCILGSVSHGQCLSTPSGRDTLRILATTGYATLASVDN